MARYWIGIFHFHNEIFSFEIPIIIIKKTTSQHKASRGRRPRKASWPRERVKSPFRSPPQRDTGGGTETRGVPLPPRSLAQGRRKSAWPCNQWHHPLCWTRRRRWGKGEYLRARTLTLEFPLITSKSFRQTPGTRCL